MCHDWCLPVAIWKIKNDKSDRYLAYFSCYSKNPLTESLAFLSPIAANIWRNNVFTFY